MELIALNTEMSVVLAVLAVTVTLFVTEVFRIDLTAIITMVALGLLSQIPGLSNLADTSRLFDGFASNAVISIIAVMIIGAGLDKTGLMSIIAGYILKVGGNTEKKIIPIIAGSVGVISSFMQNVGAAALFLPVVSRISVRTELPMSRLLMPMGFCAILGGTITMVGSSPLILLNDLIGVANSGLPNEQQMQPFGLFDVTPIGFCLVITGILYFVIFGSWVLPNKASNDSGVSAQSMRNFVKSTYGLKADIFEISVPAGSILIGHSLANVMDAHHIYIIGTDYRGKRTVAPMASTKIEAPCRLAILGLKRIVQEFTDDYGLEILPSLQSFSDDFATTQAGVAEIVVPPGSSVIGKTPGEVRYRAAHGLSLLAIHRGEETLSHVETPEHAATQLTDVPLLAGDTLVVHTKWVSLTRLSENRDYVIVTSGYPREEVRPQKVGWALVFFAIAIGMILFSDVRLSLCLLTGASGMIVTRVLSVDEAYAAIGWNTVFLLASLIPLGIAVQATGTASWIAQQVLILLDGWPVWSLQVCVAILATIFTLVMSNVGATVLLVPLAISIAIAAGGNPAIFALTVAISTSNSFFIPTHQVNALIMGPGGYRVIDFMRCGSIMTVLFLVVSMVMMNIVF
ncbi:MAG: SLC13 family permease [Planktomarina sp.]|nr:SLC13 family permease [Planktomarina sp.]